MALGWHFFPTSAPLLLVVSSLPHTQLTVRDSCTSVRSLCLSQWHRLEVGPGYAGGYWHSVGVSWFLETHLPRSDMAIINSFHALVFLTHF